MSRLLAALLLLSGLPVAAAAQTEGCEPVAQRAGRRLGCFITARETFGALPRDSALYWHIDGYATLPRYEPALIQSVRQRPSELGVAMVGRLLNSGEREVDGVSRLTLLRSIAEEPDIPGRVREVAAKFAARHP
jgi:hypothetical protein